MSQDAPAAAADPLPLAETTRLAVAARDGNAAAFETLMTRFKGVVYKIALGRCRDRTDAEDLTQEIFLHAFRSIRNLRDPQAFIAWLMGIAYNRSHRHLRVQTRKVVVLNEAREELLARARQRAAGEAEPGHASELIRSLPDEFRLALTWKYLDGLCYQEIGERLSMSFHQVDYLLRRAKRALRGAVETVRDQEGRQEGSRR